MVKYYRKVASKGKVMWYPMQSPKEFPNVNSLGTTILSSSGVNVFIWGHVQQKICPQSYCKSVTGPDSQLRSLNSQLFLPYFAVIVLKKETWSSSYFVSYALNQTLPTPMWNGKNTGQEIRGPGIWSWFSYNFSWINVANLFKMLKWSYFLKI